MSRPPFTLGFLSSIHRGCCTLTCHLCRPVRVERIPHGVLCAAYGEHVTFEALRARARCKGCGARADGQRVTFELDLFPPTREEALANMWGGFGGHQQFAEFLAQKAKGARERS